jgi:hypothetical protein
MTNSPRKLFRRYFTPHSLGAGRRTIVGAVYTRSGNAGGDAHAAGIGNKPSNIREESA